MFKDNLSIIFVKKNIIVLIGYWHESYTGESTFLNISEPTCSKWKM